MTRHLTLFAVTVFFITMNVLLWRSEFRAQGQGTPIPMANVWEKILRAPDDSQLEIFHQKKKIGHLRWAANAGELASTNSPPADDSLQEGMVRRVGGYTLDILDGRLDLPGDFKRVRFTFSSSFGTNHLWQSLSFQFTQRPLTFDLSASATNETVTLRYLNGDQNFTRSLTFAQLRNPQQLLKEIAGPLPLSLLTGGLLGGFSEDRAAPELAALPSLQKLALGVRWDCRQDWLKLGQAQLRCYRLHTRLLEKHTVTIYVSRVGEILRVELPNDLVLQNTRMLLL